MSIIVGHGCCRSLSVTAASVKPSRKIVRIYENIDPVCEHLNVFFDTEGYLTLKDRSKDLIISGGSNICGAQIGLGANASGLYACELLPIASANWTLWTSYHVVIVVTQGSNHGQTIAELTFPHP